MDQCVRGHVDRIEVKPDGRRVCLACREELQGRENAARRLRTKKHIQARREKRGVTPYGSTTNAQNTP